jgi:hypothetical protein
MKQIMVRKGDGTLEPLDMEKVRFSLRRAGAGGSLSSEVIETIEPQLYNGITTGRIYQMAFDELRELRPGAAARFGLKAALAKFGPSGYPFETFVGALLKGRKYETKLRQTLQGRCVKHEIDVLASRPAMEGHAATKCIVECKFHNAPHMKCHVQTALYSWARFLDVNGRNPDVDSGWLATNTKFTEEAIAYSDCVGLKLLGWSFPAHESIQVRIEENRLYPITVLPRLDARTFEKLHAAEIILVKEALDAPVEKLRAAGLNEKEIQRVKEDAKAVMSSRG